VGAVKMVAAVLPLATTIETITAFDHAGKVLAQQP
jgi:hypothetical protein